MSSSESLRPKIRNLSRSLSQETHLAIPPPLHLHNNSCSLPKHNVSFFPVNGDSLTRTSDETRTSSIEPRSSEAFSRASDRYRFRCAGAFFALLTAGWADGVTGTILPYIKEDFNLSYMMSSLLFITSTIGFALGVILIERVMYFLGSFRASQGGLSCSSFRTVSGRESTRRALPGMGADGIAKFKVTSPARARFRVLVIASILHACFFILMGTATGFVNILAAYFVAALGKAFLNGSRNAYVAASPKRPLGQLYACNALGAFASPFVCQTLLARGIPWSHFYLGSLVLSATNTLLLALAFRPTRSDYAEEGNDGSALCVETYIETPSVRPNGVDRDADTEEKAPTIDRSNTVPTGKTSSTAWSAPSATQKNRSTLRYALTLRYVWAFSFFMLIYSGSETSTQGYVRPPISNANPNTVGYVTSGFWGGMAISRFTTGIVSPYLNFTQPVALSMHLLIWFVNSVLENAISTAIIGLLYGPVYPSVLALAVDMLPREAHMITMAIISGFSNLGSSIFPFIVGAMSNLQGPRVLVYMTVAQTATLIVLWALFPKTV
ncbi:MFS general substrate transporter [Phellopilus nigrolimitatus]|nr:MFS general substrate transporter [Phellopilus nigrolimitatus]